MHPTHGNYDVSETDNFQHLINELDAIHQCNTYTQKVERVADILLNGHTGVSGYLTFGNTKIANNVGIFNMNSAVDCPNADSDEDNPTETGVCQVPWDDCYAHLSEQIYDNVLPKRRLQEFFWDSIDAVTFAKALVRVKERMRSSFDYLRVSQSGDFRHNGDIIKWDTIASIVSPEIEVYTYSASHKLDWSHAENFVVNQSNNYANYGDRLYGAVFDIESMPSDAILCPYDAAKKNGIENENRPKCGECTHCIEQESEQEKDVYIEVH